MFYVCTEGDNARVHRGTHNEHNFEQSGVAVYLESA